MSAATATSEEMMTPFCGLFTPLEDLFVGGVKKKSNMQQDDSDEDDDDQLISPFIAYDDGYEWPSLYDEIDGAIERNVLVYAIAELRQLANNSERNKDQRSIMLDGKSLELPFTHEQLMDVVEANQAELEKTDFGRGYVVDVLRTAKERNMMNGVVGSDSSHQEQRRVKHETVVVFDDEFAEKELVYMIEVSEQQRTVTLTFRGSVTKVDWATNFELCLKEVENPMKHHVSQKETVRIHTWFYNYMFQPNLRGVNGPNGEALSQFSEIFQEHLCPVLQQYPGFKLIITGHSLGGALATIFAFGAAALDDALAPKPVTLISIAAPYVGDESFANSFQLMESLGRLRCCRVVNQHDVVTMFPTTAFRWKSDEGAQHVGMAIRLVEDKTKPFEVMYRRKGEGRHSSWDQSLFAQFDWRVHHYTSWPWHKLRSYNERLQNQRDQLSKTYLNDLYTRREYVGRLVAEF